MRGLRLRAWDWIPARQEPWTTLVFAHATGFHGRVWDQVIRALPPTWRCVALDLRGHGRSESPAEAAAYRWQEIAADVAAAAAALGVRDAVGVGHSMGGCALAMAAARRPGLFRGLVLVDPSIIDQQDPGRRPPGTAGGRMEIAEGARRRRRMWESPAAMVASLGARPPFDTWNRAVLADYCRHGLIAQPDGRWRLACLPESEAAVFERTMDDNPWPLLPQIETPVTLLRGMAAHGLRSTTSPRAAAALRDVRDVPVAECNHFIPMERPALVAAEIVGLVRRLEGASGSA